MNYGDVLKAFEDADEVKAARAGWNGKGQWVGMQKPDASSKMTVPYLYLHTVNGDLVPWVPSQTDQLAKDWSIVSE